MFITIPMTFSANATEQRQSGQSCDTADDSVNTTECSRAELGQGTSDSIGRARDLGHADSTWFTTAGDSKSLGQDYVVAPMNNFVSGTWRGGGF